MNGRGLRQGCTRLAMNSCGTVPRFRGRPVPRLPIRPGMADFDVGPRPRPRAEGRRGRLEPAGNLPQLAIGFVPFAARPAGRAGPGIGATRGRSVIPGTCGRAIPAPRGGFTPGIESPVSRSRAVRPPRRGGDGPAPGAAARRLAGNRIAKEWPRPGFSRPGERGRRWLGGPGGWGPGRPARRPGRGRGPTRGPRADPAAPVRAGPRPHPGPGPGPGPGSVE